MSVQRCFGARNTLGAVAIAVAMGMVHTPVSAQAETGTDGRWLPWYGCWQPTGAVDDSTFLCLLPVEGERGVEMITRSKGETLSSEIVSADGLDRAVSREGCEGRERVEFSDDATRVYFHSDLVCEGGVRRVSEGMMSMLSPVEWMDVQTVDVDGEAVPWTVRYQLATSEASGVEDPTSGRAMAVGAARAAASRPPTLDDVIEASSKLQEQTVQAWVLEAGEPFALDARGLARLADAGVSETVIDGVVAVTFPERFAVGYDEERVEDGYSGRRYGSRYPYGRYYNPLYLDAFYSRSYALGFYSPFGYGRGFGFGNGFGGGFYGGGRGVVVIGRSGSGARDSGGTVVRGRGFTQGRSSGSSSGAARRRARSSSSSQGRSSVGSSRSSGSSGRASSSRGSSGSSGKASTSRKAKRRGGGS